MNRTKFAEICDISKMMVSKYHGMGLIAFVDAAQKIVDPVLSLELMAGRFDETKRRAALAKLADYQQLEAEAASLIPAPRPLAGAKPVLTAKTGPEEPEKRNSKQEKDFYEAALKRLQYMQRAGEVVLTSDVASQAELAVSAMRETFSNNKRDAAKDFCAAFDIPPDRETAVMRKLSAAFEKALGRFADVARKMAEQGPALPLIGDDGQLSADETGELSI